MSVTIDTRVAFLEGQVGEHSRMVQDVRQTVSGVEDRLGRRFESFERKLEERFALLDQKLDQRFASVDQRFAAIDQRFAAIDQRFGWLVGIQLTTLVAIVAAVLAR